MHIRFLSRGSPEQISGGYLYNRYLMEHLRQAGVPVTYHADDCGLQHVATGDIVIVDSLVLADVASTLLSMSADLVLLLHVDPCAPNVRVLGKEMLKSLFRRSRIIVTGDSTLASVRRVAASPKVDVVKIEPGVPSTWRAKEHYAKKARRLLGIASYVRGKGVLHSLRVLSQLRHLPWTMSLYGNEVFDPNYFNTVSRTIKGLRLEDRVRLGGAVPHGLINNKMIESDLLVHFSEYESYSMVTSEAIACGLPVLSHKTGNISVFQKSGLVRYVDRNKISDAALALRMLIERQTEYGRLRPCEHTGRRDYQDVGREFLSWLFRAQ